uniref:Uncharacterized protein n=1 Tax=viral metagenome TaxID=1070528 RepID=A0A6C0EY31_9ZZZZ
MSQTILLLYENNTYIKKYPTKYDNTNRSSLLSLSLSIKELFLESIGIENKLDFENDLDNNELFFLKDGIPIHPDTFVDTQNINLSSCISCQKKMRGGNFLDTIMDFVLFPFNVIFKPIGAIGNFFLFLIKFIVWLLQFIIWFIAFLTWVFVDLLNPAKFMSDFFGTIMIIVIGIVSAIFNAITSVAALGINLIGSWMQGFWGWDQSGLTINDRNSKYFKSMNKANGSKCYLTTTNTVPFSIILGTILCPPLGVFMDMGITGWLNIIICGLLTLLFYLPGLCYALLIIYS